MIAPVTPPIIAPEKTLGEKSSAWAGTPPAVIAARASSRVFIVVTR
jgi:hypothetical protein